MDQFHKYSPYVDECVKSLQYTRDHPNDQVAVALVKLQIIFERIHQSPWHAQYETSKPLVGATMLVEMLAESLKLFRQDLAQELTSNREYSFNLYFEMLTKLFQALIMMHFHHAEVYLYEVALSKTIVLSELNGPDSKRLELLSSCLRACKSASETFLLIPPADYPKYGTILWTDLVYNFIVLHALSCYDSPNWNLSYVREVLDFPDMLNSIIEGFNRVQLVKGYENLQFFGVGARRAMHIKVFMEGKMNLAHTGGKRL
jgi:hypothetical protein